MAHEVGAGQRRLARPGRAGADGRGRALVGALCLLGSRAATRSSPQSPAQAAGPVVGVASSVQVVRPTTTPSLPDVGQPGRGEERVRVGAAGRHAARPPTCPCTASLSCCEVRLYREGYYEATRQSDREGGTGRWGDILVPETDIVYGQDRNAFPFDVPAGENRVVWVDVFVPTDARPRGVTSGNLAVTSTGGTTTVPLSLGGHGGHAALDVEPAQRLLDATEGRWRQPGLLRSHRQRRRATATRAWRARSAVSTRGSALENRVTIPNGFGFGGTNETPAQWGPTWETAFEAPLDRTGRPPSPLRPAGTSRTHV